MRSIYRILRALLMALRGHRGHKDKAGKPYWHHLLTVAWIAYGLTHDAEAVVVGLLHDYLEDVKGGTDRLIYTRFGWLTYTRLKHLTRKPDEGYQEYIGSVALNGDWIVHAVKIADLLHNTDPKRLVDSSDYETQIRIGGRRHRYLKALTRLTGKRAHS